MITLIPAFGRDYRSIGAATTAFKAGEEFAFVGLGVGHGYCTHDELLRAGETRVAIRYNKQRMKCFVDLKELTSKEANHETAGK
jgi:hypothetical protein